MQMNTVTEQNVASDFENQNIIQEALQKDILEHSSPASGDLSPKNLTDTTTEKNTFTEQIKDTISGAYDKVAF